MNLGMSVGLELRQEQELEQRLEQKLEQRLTQSISLKLYLEQENFFKGLIRWVDENNRWREFKKWGFDFKYGLVPYNKFKNVADEYGPGFAHCFYNSFNALFNVFEKGSWSLFVVEGMVPKDYEKVIALHERGEELSLGNHFFASKLEFAGVKKDKKVRKYASWIDKNYPTKFVDLIEPVLFPILPEELRNYLEQTDCQHNQEVDIAEDMIERYPLPTSVMKLVVKYDDINEEVEGQLNEFVGPCQNVIYHGGKLGNIVDSINQIISDCIKKIPEDYIRVLVPRRMETIMNGPLHTVKKDFRQKTNYNLNINYDLFELYKTIKEGKPVVEINY